mmetsp:Transcript_26805/g.85129  ORF Transcript_26805/g.85129 Transcript_26805/m.85129 type:complete len:232 (-) Transcript_26805:414-1109(-)
MHLAFRPTGRPSEPSAARSLACSAKVSSLLRISQISTFEAPCQPASSVLTTTMENGAVGHQMARQGAVWCVNTASRSNVGLASVVAPLLQLVPPSAGLLLSPPQRSLNMTVRRSREQLARRVPQGEKTTKSTSSECSSNLKSNREGAFRTLFSSSCFQDRKRNGPPRLPHGPREGPAWPRPKRCESAQVGGARKENRLFPARDGLCRMAAVLFRRSCSHASRGAAASLPPS